MEFIMQKISLKTRKHSEFIDITPSIQDIVRKSGVESGVCHVFIPHTTAGITINENADPDVIRDIIAELDTIVPLEDNYAHTEGNSAAHIKSSMMGCSQTTLIEGGRLSLGTWQSLFFCEFDGPRNRSLWIKILS
jgi:secondary thiamine-phosphate synthase enzyme